MHFFQGFQEQEVKIFVELLYQKEDEQDDNNEEVHSLMGFLGTRLVAEVSVALSHHSDRL